MGVKTGAWGMTWGERRAGKRRKGRMSDFMASISFVMNQKAE